MILFSGSDSKGTSADKSIVTGVIKYNGTELNRIFYNGVQVYGYGLISFSYHFYTVSPINSTSGKTYYEQYITLTINNNYYQTTGSTYCPVLYFISSSSPSHPSVEYQTSTSHNYIFDSYTSVEFSEVQIVIGCKLKSFNLSTSSISSSWYAGF